MASWQDLNRFALMLHGRRLNDTMWMLQIPGSEPGRSQKVFLSLELMQPDFQFLRIASPVAMIADVDLGAVLRSFGQLQVGCFSFSPAPTNGRPDNGFVNIGTVIPMAALDLRQPETLLIYLSVLAQAADTLERTLTHAGVPDMF